jgi:hypothetical protein
MRLIGVTVLVLLPIGVLLAVWIRTRQKERAMAAFASAVQRVFIDSGWEALGESRFRRAGRGAKFELSTNPLFSHACTVRLAAYSSTLHEFELKRGAPVPEEFRPFAPLLERWDSAGKMFTECYVAGVTGHPPAAGDLETLAGIARLPIEKTWTGGTFTIREGFEEKVPQWHWRHDQRPRLSGDTRRYCVSYWTGSPLLNPPLIRLFMRLADGCPMHYMTDSTDLSFLELAFGPGTLVRKGTLVEFHDPSMPVAADLHEDGSFFGGILVAPEPPEGFEERGLSRRTFHDAALRVFRKCQLYIRRLWDDEFSWFSGEYEILSERAIDVRGAVARLASEMGAQVLEIDRRFHRRIVQPLEY